MVVLRVWNGQTDQRFAFIGYDRTLVHLTKGTIRNWRSELGHLRGEVANVIAARYYEDKKHTDHGINSLFKPKFPQEFEFGF
jgi:hypothetical protein